MKKTSKATTIYKAFTEKPDVSVEVLMDRRKKCQSCPFNSLNIAQKDKSLTDRIREKMMSSAFCTKCGCNIAEKTGRAVEKCPKNPPEWNATKVETKSKRDFNLINKSEGVVDVDISDDDFVVEFGEVQKGHEFSNIVLVLETKQKDEFRILKTKPSCGTCTFCESIRLNPSQSEITFRVTTQNFPLGDVTKAIRVEYQIGPTVDYIKLLLKFKIKE